MNTQHNDGHWRETQFTSEQWACVPTTASPWHSSPAPPGADDRLRTAEEIALVLHAIIVSHLSPRQRRVMELYYLENKTQEQVATELGISQATVSQHLTGKRRGRTRVGGAFRKIRKSIHKAAGLRAHDDTRYAEIITALDKLLDASITRRRVHQIMACLALQTPRSH